MRSTIRKCEPILLALSVLGGLLAAACSSVAPSSAKPGIDNKVVTIGLSSVMSGPMASYSQISDAAKIYFDMVNRTGGVNGYTFKIVERDNALQPAQGVAVAQQLVNEDRVFAMVTEGTPVVQAVVPIAASLKTPMIAGGDGDLIRPTIANVFGTNPRYTLLPLFEAQYLIKNLGIKDIAYVYEDDASGRPGLKYMADFVTNNGAKLDISLGWAVDTTDWAPFAQKVKDSGAQGVVFFNPSGLAAMQKAADAIGYHPKWITNWGNLTPSYVKLAGPLSEGVYIDSMMQPADASTPEAQQFRDELKAAGKESILGAPAGQGWTTAAIIVEGVRKATANGGALTRDSYIGALNSFTNQQAGLYPSVTYTPEDHSGISQSSVYQVQDGKFAQVLPMTDIPQPGVN
jgi:branched-chain amino acid transport system substrate-binding protein